MNDILKKIIDSNMVKEFKDFFSNGSMTSASQLIQTVNQIVAYLEQIYKDDAPQFNAAIEHLKEMLDQHKK